MKAKIKIGFISYSVDIGGVETLILEIGKRLKKGIFEPSIFVFEKVTQVLLPCNLGCCDHRLPQGYPSVICRNEPVRKHFKVFLLKRFRKPG